MKIKFLTLLFLLTIPAAVVSAETLTMTTYYPAPYGAYDRIRLVPRAALSGTCQVGTMYVLSPDDIQYCQDTGGGPNAGTWGNLPGVWTQSGNNIYPTDTTTNTNLRVGIGTTSPGATFHVTKTNGTSILAQNTTGTGLSALATTGNALVASSASGWAGYFTGKEYVSSQLSVGSLTPPSNTSIYGYNNTGVGVMGESGSGWAGYFSGKAHVSQQLLVGSTGPSNAAIYAYKTTPVTINGVATTGQAIAGDATSGQALVGTATSGNAIVGTSASGWAGYFSGKAYVSGNLGVGTLSPGAKIHAVATSGTGNAAIIADASSLSGGAGVVAYSGSYINGCAICGHASGSGWAGSFNGQTWIQQLVVGSSMFSGGAGVIVHGDTGAKLTTGGTWQDASSRELKKDIEPLALAKAYDALEKLQPVTFKYKAEDNDEYVGFIAEDVPDLVASTGRKTLHAMDIVAVLTKIVQDQEALLKEQQETLDRQQKEIEYLKEKINK